MAKSTEMIQCMHSGAEIYRRLIHSVVDRFTRLTDLTVVVIPIHPDMMTEQSSGRYQLRHPLCNQVDQSADCHTSWQEHMIRLQQSPHEQDHDCRSGFHCSLVPVIYDQHCLAACKLVTPVEESREDAFENKLEILRLLIENFIIREKELLSGYVKECLDHASSPVTYGGNSLSHRLVNPQILRAIAYIERHLTEQNLNVEAVARALEMNSAYLAHLFVTVTGIRMSHYITTQRITYSKKLLTETDWQVKNVAEAAGYKNRAWFNEVFRKITGQTPGVYRRQQKKQKKALSHSLRRQIEG